MCNLPYSEKPFISGTVLPLMDRLDLSVSGIEDYHLFTDRYYNSVELAQELDNQKCMYTFCLFTLCPCCTNFSGKTLRLVARQAFINPWCPASGNFSKHDRKRLNATFHGYQECFGYRISRTHFWHAQGEKYLLASKHLPVGPYITAGKLMVFHDISYQLYKNVVIHSSFFYNGLQQETCVHFCMHLRHNQLISVTAKNILNKSCTTNKTLFSLLNIIFP
jgi:hypothetical protein